MVVAGGVGLAPLRPVVYKLLRRHADYGRVTLLYGARTPGDLRHDLRTGGARDALPGAGDAGGVRRHLPRLRPRVLRLLRPGRVSEAAGARGSVAALGAGPEELSRALRGVNAWAPGFREGGRDEQ